MAAIVSLIKVSKSFSLRPLFDDISFVIEENDRIGLIGPNGAGKSTMMKLIAGKHDPDKGTIAFQKGARVALLDQVPEFTKGRTILETVLENLADPDDPSHLGLAYEWLSKIGADDSTPGLNAETLVDRLSGGWKKRVALARELIKEPDLLLLDEPTNHLDVESILWLENLIKSSSFATLTITHDRYFLQNVSRRILELDRRNPDGLLDIKGNYNDYIESKNALLQTQEKLETKLKNTFRREQEWLRSGTKARTTKQQARIQRTHELEAEVREVEYRNTDKKVDLSFSAQAHKPKMLLKADGISKSYGDEPLFSNLDILITPEERLGLLGRNGCGKSTLIRVLLGQEKLDVGEVFRSPHLKVAFFEQNREALDLKSTPIKTLAPHGDQVIYCGRPIHVRGYLDRFLFTQDHMNMPVGSLSGGEQSRLLLAKLMLQDVNLLVLDEPTNDLDLPTLALLEECLDEFEGAVVLVSHDRSFMDRVSDRIMAFDPVEPGVVENFASLNQWQAWHSTRQKAANAKAKGAPAKSSTPKKKRLGYLEERELTSMEVSVQKAEKRLLELNTQSQAKDQSANATKILELSQQMVAVQAEIDQLYARWQELEDKQKGN